MNFSKVKIQCRPAKGLTKKIKISWIKEGKQELIWSNGRADTESGEHQILALLK